MSLFFAFQAMRSGTVHGLLIWWDMHMSEDASTAHVLSTVPHCYRRGQRDGKEGEHSSKPPSREHWMQAACVLPLPVAVHAGSQVLVTCAVSRDGLAPRFAIGHQGDTWLNRWRNASASVSAFCICVFCEPDISTSEW